jgi:hypothetical protein
MYSLMAFDGAGAAARCCTVLLATYASKAKYVFSLIAHGAGFLLTLAFPAAAEASRYSGGRAYIVLTPLFFALSAGFFVLLTRSRKRPQPNTDT